MKTSCVIIFMCLFFVTLFCAGPLYAATEFEIPIFEKADEDAEPLISTAVGYVSSNLRDPFVWFGSRNKTEDKEQASGVSPPTISLEGMVWDSQMPQAIINGQIAKAGDTVSGCKIIQIDRDGVMVSYQGRFFVSTPGGKFQLAQPKGEAR